MTSTRDIDPEVARWRAKLSRATQLGNADAIAEARRELEIAKFQDKIRRFVRSAPKLTREDQRRIRQLMGPIIPARGKGQVTADE